MNAKENSATKINSDARVFFLQCVDKMQCIVFGCIFHHKVIKTKLNLVSRVACLKRPGVKPARV